MSENTIIDQASGANWSMYHGDCVALASEIPDNSIDISVYSPPFSQLYVYSESEADLGNVDGDDQFLEQYRFLVREKLRVTRPGRLSCIHVKDLVFYQNSSGDGSSGIRPFSDECTRIHLEEGWKLQCRVTIWRDPVLERAKTNAHGLLYKTFRTDASYCRVGMPEYLLVFRKWPKTDEEAALQSPVIHDQSTVPLPAWQELASPIWPAYAAAWNYRGPIEFADSLGEVNAIASGGQSGGGDYDLRATDVLNVKQSADPSAERHLCPMPMNITSRALQLWSNRGDVLWSPFAGIGSEGVVSLKIGRKFIGSELNPSYFASAVKHLMFSEQSGHQLSLFESIR